MRVPDIAIVISIAVLYPMFFRKLADVLMNRQEISDMCGSWLEPKNMSEAEKKECEKKKEVKLKKVNLVRFVTLLVSGLVALAMSYYLMIPSLSAGLAISGLLVIIDATWRYWNDMNEKVKLVMIGIALVCVMAIPKMVNNFSQITYV